jgi:solute carrier family 35 protein E3
VVSAHALFLLFNFCSSIAVIFINKSIFIAFKFEFTTALTALHYVVTLAGLEALALSGAYEKRSSPTTPRLLMLSFVVGTAPAINNLSLKLNGVGFYQVVKLLVTPGIVALEWACFGAGMSTERAVALLGICVGVGVAGINDVHLNWAGTLAAATWVPVAALYKVFWSHVTKEEKWDTLALMRRVLPLSTAILLVMTPLVDPPGLLAFEWSATRAGAVLLSGVAAFFVNWSGFLVMGACSALTHTVLGQLKACVIILFGWLLLAQVYPPKAICGAAAAIASVIAYTRANLAEQAASRRAPDEAELTAHLVHETHGGARREVGGMKHEGEPPR